mgnify:CR=1 FL=1
MENSSSLSPPDAKSIDGIYLHRRGGAARGNVETQRNSVDYILSEEALRREGKSSLTNSTFKSNAAKNNAVLPV